MEPIPYFYGSIDRNAILVRPKQPFLDRANSLFQDGTKLTSYDECNIYLIREMHSNEEVLHWVRENFDELFVNELNDWFRAHLKIILRAANVSFTPLLRCKSLT